ncbi:MAG TPA: exodeoxyribonuclease V subunit alpha [Methylophaga sp.]|nr:exodeoxyribonuclease V subunit alpha [Methylophaga sp.]
MSKVMKVLKQAGFTELACQFARYIERVDNGNDQLMALSAGLLTEAVSQGHVCLNLNQMTGLFHSVRHLLPDDVSEWQRRLKLSNVVGTGDDYRPLIMADNGLVYLYRYWHDEQHVATAITQRHAEIALTNHQQLKQILAEWPTTIDGIDWQKVAVLMALTRQFSVISGGPGTGKTTIVLRLLHCLYQQRADLRIALAAPTGKAAARLQHVISDKDNTAIQAKTLHRLLGINAHNEQGRYNADRPLPFDVIIVDEASMIDISLMAKLLQALAPTARLVLLGDSQQLASVESGAVLANLCQHAMSFDADFVTMVADLAAIDLSDYARNDEANNTHSALQNSVVKLQHSYRFDEASLIGRLAYAIQAGKADKVVLELTEAGQTTWQQDENNALLIAGYQPYFNAITASENPLNCIEAFENYRVLCAIKQGPQSVASVNAVIERQIAKLGWRSQHDFYHGRPIMITQNDYRQQLFNGDTGLILKDEAGQLRACFLIDNVLRWVDLIRLPAHETAFAITIHKSQGSEFEHVCVVLPQEDTAILNRELLYTAITRAKKQVMLFCNETILRKTVMTQHERESGLAGLLDNQIG